MHNVAPLSPTWIAAIHASAEDFEPLGAAVVIDDRRLLTSAHVVRTADKARTPLWVAFPMSEDPAACRLCTVAVRLAKHSMADLAVVELVAPVPEGVSAAPLRCPKPTDVVGRAWWAFGFPGQDPRGNEAAGTVGAVLGYGWVRLDTTTSPHLVAPGFSGGGLWSPDYGAVVGVVGTADDRGDAQAITLHQADGYLPEEKIRELTQWTVAAAGEMAQAAWGWTLATDKEADRHWRPRARGVSVAAERGHRFRGRSVALTEIVTWLNRSAPDRKVLVVTGSPGVGKSAVLGRIVTTADAEMRAALPPDDDAVRAEVGSVACAVHTKGKTALDVATEIARAASAPLPDRVEDLSAGLREVLAEQDGGRFNIVLDALDEASDPAQARAIITGIVLPIAATCAEMGAQVVVGTRRNDGGGDLLQVFGPAHTAIDLDEVNYFAVEDLAIYAQATLQLRGDERPSNPYQPDAVAAPVAVRIAQLAEKNFLIAGLVARTHGLYDTTPISPASVAFTPSVESTLATFLDRLVPVSDVSARDLLTALAFAEAPGLPPELWQLAVLTLTGAHVTPEQLIRFARGSAANFVIESAGESATVVFRLFHQALSDALAMERSRSSLGAADDAALTRAFSNYGDGVGWNRAPIYLFRSLPGHALRGGMLDELLTDSEYVLHTDLRRLIPAAAGAHTSEGVERTHLLRLTLRAIPAEPAQRLALLSVNEALDGLGTTFRHHPRRAPYRGLWATTPPRVEWAVLDGHDDWVNGVCAIQVDGRELLASASTDRTIRIWNPATGTTERTLTGHTNGVNGVCAIQVDGRELLASASADRTIRIWNPATGTTERTLTGHTDWVNGLCAIQVDGRELLASASADDDGTVRFWDPATGRTKRTLKGHVGGVWDVCAVRVGSRELLASASADDDGLVQLWEPNTGITKRTLTGHTAWVNGVCAVRVHDQELLASASNDHSVRIWDPATGTNGIPRRRTYPVPGVCTIRLGDQELLASASYDATLRIWDPATGTTERTLTGHTDWVREVCAIRVDGQELLASASNDWTVRIWHPNTDTTERILDEHTNKVLGVCVVWVNGRELLASASADRTIRIWNPATGTTERTLTGHTDWVNGVCAVRVADRELLASASADRTIRIWNPATGTTERTLTGHTSGVNGVCAVRVADRELLASASADRTVRIWEPATGQTIHLIPTHYEALGLVSVDNDRLVVGLSAGILALSIADVDDDRFGLTRSSTSGDEQYLRPCR